MGKINDINNITLPVYKRLKESTSAIIKASNITALSDNELNALKVGDVVQKITGEQKHCYTVTYKQEKHGICLTYVDAGYMETVSYDYSGGHWVYNSTDVIEVPTDAHIKGLIEADKDIISQIDYDGTTVYFPENVYPLMITSDNDDTYYFDYGNEKLKDSQNNDVNGIILTSDSNKVSISFDSEEDVFNILDIVCIERNMNEDESAVELTFNTYYLFNPKAILDYELDEDITISNLPNGLNCYYAHARISNGKLNVVFAFNSEINTPISSTGGTVNIGTLLLPSDVLSKLIPYVSTNLDTKYGYITSANWQSNGKTILQILKGSSSVTFNLNQEAVTTVSSTGCIRFEFNFLL